MENFGDSFDIRHTPLKVLQSPIISFFVPVAMWNVISDLFIVLPRLNTPMCITAAATAATIAMLSAGLCN